MSKKQTLTVTFPDGTTGKRTTERTYTHVVAVKHNSSDGTQKWVVTNWCGSETLARKQKFASAVILPVNPLIAPDVPVTPVASAPAAVCPECACECRHFNTYNDPAWGETYSYRCGGCSQAFDLSFPSSEVTTAYGSMPGSVETIRAAQLADLVDGTAHFWYSAPDGKSVECDGIVGDGINTYKLYAKDSGDIFEVTAAQILWIEYTPEPRSLRVANLAIQHEYTQYVTEPAEPAAPSPKFKLGQAVNTRFWGESVGRVVSISPVDHCGFYYEVQRKSGRIVIEPEIYLSLAPKYEATLPRCKPRKPLTMREIEARMDTPDHDDSTDPRELRYWNHDASESPLD